MRHISLVMPYYDNPGMLAIHYEAWSKLPQEIKDRIDIVLVDDGSPGVAAAEVPRPEGLPQLTIFRVLVDKPWHQHAARNIGAHHAKGPWLVLTDIDHLVPMETWEALFKIKNGSKAYTFTRLDAPYMVPKYHPQTGEPHPHPNSFAMTKALYWLVGGYDEDFCGVYGTDGLFRNRLWAVAPQSHLSATLIRYSREVQGDAATQTLPRKEGRPPNAKKDIMALKKSRGTLGKVSTLTMPYLKVFP